MAFHANHDQDKLLTDPVPAVVVHVVVVDGDVVAVIMRIEPVPDVVVNLGQAKQIQGRKRKFGNTLGIKLQVPNEDLGTQVANTRGGTGSIDRRHHPRCSGAHEPTSFPLKSPPWCPYE